MRSQLLRQLVLADVQQAFDSFVPVRHLKGYIIFVDCHNIKGRFQGTTGKS